jgi:hypothetical protein
MCGSKRELSIYAWLVYTWKLHDGTIELTFISFFGVCVPSKLLVLPRWQFPEQLDQFNPLHLYSGSERMNFESIFVGAFPILLLIVLVVVLNLNSCRYKISPKSSWALSVCTGEPDGDSCRPGSSRYAPQRTEYVVFPDA